MSSPPPKLPGSGPEPLEVAAILGVGLGWALGGIGTLIGFGAVAFSGRWSVSQKAVAIAGPIAMFLGPLAIAVSAGSSAESAAVLSMILGVVGSIASAVYLWFTLPERDGSVG